MKVYFKYISIIYITLQFSACGGSSSTTPITPDSSGSNNNTENAVKVKGIAVDDLIVNGLVKIYSTATPRILLGEGRTGSETGAYTLNIAYDGVVILEVLCDASSLMKNPDTNTTKACEDDLSLQSAAVLSPDIEELEVNISPVSDLVVKQMKEKGSSKEALESAQDNIGQIFGFDPLGDSPIENDNYKKTVASIRELADDKNITMVEVIALINEDMVDGKSGDDGTIASELATVMEENGVINTFTENDGAVEPEESTDRPEPTPTATPTDVPAPTPTATPTPTPTPTKSDIQISKEFFNDLRTQAMSIVDYDNTGTKGFLDTESEVLGEKMENISLNIGLVAEHSTGIIGLVTEAIDEGVDSKIIEVGQDDEETDSSSQPTTQKGGEPLISRTVEVRKTANPKVWDYSIEDNTSATYTGTITLPAADVSSITASNFTSLTAKFEGKLPLRSIDSTQSVGEQTVKLDLEITKSARGADLELKELSIQNADDSIAIKTLKGKVAYTHDTDSDEVTLESVELETITLKATIQGYELDGKLDITEYVTNSSLVGKGFQENTEEYATELHGQVSCAGEHNEESYSNNLDGNIIYTDLSSVEHTLKIRTWGDFYDRIEGNVHELNEGESIQENAYHDSNYSNYIGLTFDNISVSSPSCTNIILEDVYINAREEYNQTNTYVGISLFCKESNGEKSDITDATGTFTDALGVTHTLEQNGQNNLFSSYEGNSEGITLDSANIWFDIQGGETFNRIAISEVNSECTNPKLKSLSISISPQKDNDIERIFTNIYGEIICDGGVIPTEATVVYTDRLANSYTLLYENNQFHVDYNNRIEGNTEELILNNGYTNYRAIGHILDTSSLFSVTDSSCPNPVFKYYRISLQSHENESIYNSGVLPKKAKFVGSIKNTTTTGEINGELNVEWKNAQDMNLTDASEDKPELEVTLKGKIKVPNRPEMILNLGFKNPTANNNFTLSYQYGTTVLNGIATFDEEMTNGTLAFTGTNGIKLIVKIEDGETLYGEDSPVTRNGRKIGELQDRTGVPVIKYTDGSFESLP